MFGSGSEATNHQLRICAQHFNWKQTQFGRDCLSCMVRPMPVPRTSKRCDFHVNEQVEVSRVLGSTPLSIRRNKDDYPKQIDEPWWIAEIIAVTLIGANQTQRGADALASPSGHASAAKLTCQFVTTRQGSLQRGAYWGSSRTRTFKNECSSRPLSTRRNRCTASPRQRLAMPGLSYRLSRTGALSRFACCCQ